uniref:Uncharacterized protein n=1 Tax=Anguilla anguilla TaxID=7936 RepID=A0A0E9SSJ5_ANGAN
MTFRLSEQTHPGTPVRGLRRCVMSCHSDAVTRRGGRPSLRVTAFRV